MESGPEKLSAIESLSIRQSPYEGSNIRYNPIGDIQILQHMYVEVSGFAVYKF